MLTGSPSSVLTLGLGSWGSTGLLLTLGFGVGEEGETGATASWAYVIFAGNKGHVAFKGDRGQASFAGNKGHVTVNSQP